MNYNDDGTRLEARYTGAGGANDKTELTRIGENGNPITKTVWDRADQKDWGRIVSHYDTDGHRTGKTQHNDDGSRLEYAFADDGKVRVLKSFDEDGVLKERTVWDRENSHDWSKTVQEYNDQGQKVFQTAYLDNGRRVETRYNDRGETTHAVEFDDQGRKRKEAYWDRDDKHSWDHFESEFNENGVLIQKFKTGDDGNTYREPGNGFGYSAIGKYDDGDPDEAHSHGSSAGGCDDDFLRTYVPPSVPPGTILLDPICLKAWPPVALDLNGDGQIDIRPLDLTADDGPRLDWNGDGIAEKTAWVGPNDGFVGIDLNGDGRIDAPEINFVSQLQEQDVDPAGHTDMSAARQLYDTNGNGALDPEDARWTDFLVWQDKDQNWSNDPGELISLSEAGIESIGLVPDETGATALPDGSAITGTSTYAKTDGTTGVAGNIMLAAAFSAVVDMDGDSDVFLFNNVTHELPDMNADLIPVGNIINLDKPGIAAPLPDSDAPTELVPFQVAANQAADEFIF